MLKFKKQSKRIFRITLSLLVSSVLIFSSIIFVSAENTSNQAFSTATASGTVNMFPAQVKDGVAYDISELTLDKLPNYMNEVLGTEELENGKKPVSLSVDDSNDLSSLTTVNEDGTHTLYLFDTPIKYVDGESIKFIDNNIKKADNISVDSNTKLSSNVLPVSAASGYTNTANCFDINMPSSINQGVTLEYDNLKVSIFPSSLSSAKATLKTVAFRGTTEQVVEYRDVFGSGIHLQYTPTNKGVKENIILDSYNGINTFRFTVNTGDYYPLYTEGEAIPFVDPTTDKITFILGQTDARDSYSGEETDGHFTLYNSLSLTKIKDGIYSLIVTIDPEFLANENTVYPVIIDPSITLTSDRLYDTTVYSGKPDTQTFYSSSYNIVGYHGSSYGTGIAYLKTTRLSKIQACMDIDPNKIITAYYRAYEGSGKTNSMNIRVCGSSSNWGTQTVTYNNRPAYDDGAITFTTVSQSGWHKFDITRHIRSFLKYAKGTGGYTQERGFILEATDSTASSKHFCSAEYSGSYTPSVIINYTPSTYDITGTHNASGNQPFKAWGRLINGNSPLLKLQISTSGTYVFETMASSYFTGTQSTDTYLELFDSNFNRKSINNDQLATNKYAKIRISLSPGTYYLMVSAYDATYKEYRADNVKCYLIVEKEGELFDKDIYPDMTYEFYKIGDADSSYNCMNYALDVYDNSELGSKPVDTAIGYLTQYGWSEIPQVTDNCIVAYGSQYMLMHYSKIVNGVVTAKLNAFELVQHVSYDAYFNNSYKLPVKYFKKQ